MRLPRKPGHGLHGANAFIEVRMTPGLEGQGLEDSKTVRNDLVHDVIAFRVY